MVPLIQGNDLNRDPMACGIYIIINGYFGVKWSLGKFGEDPRQNKDTIFISSIISQIITFAVIVLLNLNEDILIITHICINVSSPCLLVKTLLTPHLNENFRSLIIKKQFGIFVKQFILHHISLTAKSSIILPLIWIFISTINIKYFILVSFVHMLSDALTFLILHVYVLDKKQTLKYFPSQTQTTSYIDLLMFGTMKIVHFYNSCFLPCNTSNSNTLLAGFIVSLYQDYYSRSMLITNSDATYTSNISKESSCSVEGEVKSKNAPLQLTMDVSFDECNDVDLVNFIKQGSIPLYNIEKFVKGRDRAVVVRRKYLFDSLGIIDDNKIPYDGYDYSLVANKCCENVIGHVPLPLGIAGPLLINGNSHWVPLATTEGCLVASTNRGLSALMKCSGVVGAVYADGMTRAPVIKTNSIRDSIMIMDWLRVPANFSSIKAVFDSTSNHARLESVSCQISGRLLYIRFKATCGDAMGMNMVSIGVNACMLFLKEVFLDLFTIVSISGNTCTDKKSSAINWINGRGKSVVCDAELDASVVEKVFKVEIDKMVEANIAKNMIGSSLAGTLGGNNCHAANVVAAIFAATGQDLAQVVSSCQCLTHIEKINGKLYISCTMPTVEVATVGGGTGLVAQNNILKLMKLNQGSHTPTENFSLVVCGTVLAAELSLLASLVSGTLVSSHIKYNRGCSGIIGQCHLV